MELESAIRSLNWDVSPETYTSYCATLITMLDEDGDGSLDPVLPRTPHQHTSLGILYESWCADFEFRVTQNEIAALIGGNPLEEKVLQQTTDLKVKFNLRSNAGASCSFFDEVLKAQSTNPNSVLRMGRVTRSVNIFSPSIRSQHSALNGSVPDGNRDETQFYNFIHLSLTDFEVKLRKPKAEGMLHTQAAVRGEGDETADSTDTLVRGKVDRFDTIDLVDQLSVHLRAAMCLLPTMHLKEQPSLPALNLTVDMSALDVKASQADLDTLNKIVAGALSAGDEPGAKAQQKQQPNAPARVQAAPARIVAVEPWLKQMEVQFVAQ